MGVVENTRMSEEGETNIVIQGGANGLEKYGPERTVRRVMEGVEKMADRKQNLKIVVCGIMRRTMEGERFEEMRRRTNQLLWEELQRRHQERVGGATVEMVMVESMGMEFFRRDRVRLNQWGTEEITKRIWEALGRGRDYECMTEGRIGGGRG
jgi:hypothetical protein